MSGAISLDGRTGYRRGIIACHTVSHDPMSLATVPAMDDMVVSSANVVPSAPSGQSMTNYDANKRTRTLPVMTYFAAEYDSPPCT